MSAAWIGAGAIFAFLGVAFGAFGAHGLEGRLAPRMLEIWETGARYQMYHALGLIAVGLWAERNASTSLAVSGWAFAIGIVLFSGSLYALALSGVRILGAVTPLGGAAFMIGWIALAISALRAP